MNNTSQPFHKLLLSKIFVLIIFALAAACTSLPPVKTAPYVDINRYYGKWYVIASRPTSFEVGAHNATESYSPRPNSEIIDVDFRYRKDSFTGPEETIPQKAWIHDSKTNSHLKISLWWIPWSLDYLILHIAPDYSWTAVGVPNQDYLWIMSREPKMSDEQLQAIIKTVEEGGYSVKNVSRVPQE